MSKFTQPAIPEILTERNWQKNKGIIAKSQGETGIGARMKKIAAAHARVKWDVFSVAKSIPNFSERTRDNLEKLKQEAEAEKVKCLAIRSDVLQLAQEANNLSREWEKSKLIPASSRKHAEKVANEASEFYAALDKYQWFCEIDEAFARAKKNAELALAVINRFGKPVDSALIAVMNAARKQPFVHADVLNVYNNNLQPKLLVLASAAEGIAKFPELKEEWSYIAKLARFCATFKAETASDWTQLTATAERKLVVRLIQLSHM